MKARPTTLTGRNKAARVLWNIVCALLYRPTPSPLHAWRRMLLRCFGARIASGAHPYPKARIWAPWNLTMERNSCLANYVDCYSVDSIVIGQDAVVSQYTYLCAASHDYEDHRFPLITAPIRIGVRAWVAADVFIGPGVDVGDGAVVAARSTVVKDVAPWSVVAGNPARFVKFRQLGRNPGESPSHQMASGLETLPSR